MQLAVFDQHLAIYLNSQKTIYIRDFMANHTMRFSAVVTKGKIAYVAYCPELGVTSQGRTSKSAIKNLEQAVELYLGDEDVRKMLAEKKIKRAKISTITVSA